MKAGILTFHKADNYGAVLQAYALQKTLTSMGVVSEFIEFCDSVRKGGEFLSKAAAKGGAAAFAEKLHQEKGSVQNFLAVFVKSIFVVLRPARWKRQINLMLSMMYLLQAATRFGMHICRRPTGDIFSLLLRRINAFPMQPVLEWTVSLFK